MAKANRKAAVHGWRNHTSTAQSVHHYGKLIPMDRPLKDEGRGYEQLDIWDEQPPVWLGMLVIAAGIFGVVAAVLLVQALHSFQQPPAAQSSADLTSSAARNTPTSGVGAVAGNEGEGL